MNSVRLVPHSSPPLVHAVNAVTGAWAGTYGNLVEAVKACRAEGRQIVNERDFAELLRSHGYEDLLQQ